jgi:hypothetical protein
VVRMTPPTISPVLASGRTCAGSVPSAQVPGMAASIPKRGVPADLSLSFGPALHRVLDEPEVRYRWNDGLPGCDGSRHVPAQSQRSSGLARPQQRRPVTAVRTFAFLRFVTARATPCSWERGLHRRISSGAGGHGALWTPRWVCETRLRFTGWACAAISSLSSPSC